MVNATPTVLVFSAGFGDGHNSAARGIIAAIDEVSEGRVRALKVDLFPESVPRLETFLKWGYGFVTTHLPRVWGLMYRMAEKDSGKGNLGWKWYGDLHRHMSRKLAIHQPVATLSTFPMYPYLIAEDQWGVPKPRFNGTVITDSISINSVWTNAPTDRYFVTDEFSSQLLVQQRAKSPSSVEATGFAVAPAFGKLTPRPLNTHEASGFRVFYLATASLAEVSQTLLGLLRDTPTNVHLTIGMGRHEARLGEKVRSLAAKFPHRSTTILGWTTDMPRLMTDHDVVLSKGGGATVHECFAAGTPVMVNYFIPGQEEGNVELVKRLGCGWYFQETSLAGQRLAELFTNGQWQQCKAAMLRHRNPDGARRIAQRTLEMAQLNI